MESETIIYLALDVLQNKVDTLEGWQSRYSTVTGYGYIPFMDNMARVRNWAEDTIVNCFSNLYEKTKELDRKIESLESDISELRALVYRKI